MAKADKVKQLEEDLELALQDQTDTNPPVLTVHDTQDQEGISLLQVDSTSLDIEEMGIPFVFPLDKLHIMQARALAYGVILERRYS